MRFSPANLAASLSFDSGMKSCLLQTVLSILAVRPSESLLKGNLVSGCVM